MNVSEIDNNPNQLIFPRSVEIFLFQREEDGLIALAKKFPNNPTIIREREREPVVAVFLPCG